MSDQDHRLDDRGKSAYVKSKFNLDIKPKTFRNWRCAGKGPPSKYFGNKAISTPPELDRWIESELKDQPANRRANANTPPHYDKVSE